MTSKAGAGEETATSYALASFFMSRRRWLSHLSLKQTIHLYSLSEKSIHPYFSTSLAD
jgi:hypothetical protein